MRRLETCAETEIWCGSIGEQSRDRVPETLWRNEPRWLSGANGSADYGRSITVLPNQYRSQRLHKPAHLMPSSAHLREATPG